MPFMKKDFDSADLFRIVGLGVRKKNPEDLKYGRFNRRMMAATIDSFVLVVALPVIDPIFRFFYGAPPVDLHELQQQARLQATPEAAAQLYWGSLYSSGYLHYWSASTAFQFAFLALFAALCWMRWSATPGKMIMRLKVVDAKTEGKISFLQCIVRALAYFVSGLCFGLGFFWIGIDKRRQGWHDKLADTLVVTVPWKPFKHMKKEEGGAVTPASEAAGP